LAVWFMDDGVTSWTQKKREEHPNSNFTPEVYFCTNCFPKEMCEVIIAWLKEKYGIESGIKIKSNANKTKQYNLVSIRFVSVGKFFSIISPHILPSMRYKVDYEEYKKWRVRKDEYKLTRNREI